MDFDKLSNSSLTDKDDSGMEQDLINNTLKDEKTGIEVKKIGDIYEVWRHGAKVKEYKRFDLLLQFLVDIVKGDDGTETKPVYDEIPEKTE